MNEIEPIGNSFINSSKNACTNNSEIIEAYAVLENAVFTALETYSNVHRGSGHNSMVTTHLYEQARKIVLEYMGLDSRKYIVIFFTPRGAEIFKRQLNPENYQSLSSNDIRLQLGVRAIAVEKRALRGRLPYHPGGGTTNLISFKWIIWANAPERFEAGTPSIINVIAFAGALSQAWQYGNEIIPGLPKEPLSADQILYNDELKEFSGQELMDKLRLTLIGRSILVPTTNGERPFINLDNSASTPTFEPIWKAVCQTLQQTSQIQQEIINKVRVICSEILGASLTDYDLIFTSNTTEAINLVAESYCHEPGGENREPVILSTLLEHSSNDLPWRMVPRSSLIRLSLDNEGFFDLKEIEAILQEYNQKDLHGKRRIKLVAASGASNVLGIYNNLKEISRIAHHYGAQMLVDAAQLIAHRKMEMELYGIDYLAFSAHKVYAPFGTGVLVARKGLMNFNHTELEQIQSSGEENAGGIAALGKSIVLLQRIGFDIIQEEEKVLTRRLLTGMSNIPGITIYGINNPESQRFNEKGGVIAFTQKGLMSDKVAKELSIRGGIGIRYGCHCAHILVKHILGVPPSLEKFQRLIVRLFPKLRLPGVARVSIGIENTVEHVDLFIQTLSNIANKNHHPDNDISKKMNSFLKEREKRVYTLKHLPPANC